jgi:hypothetical protein
MCLAAGGLAAPAASWQTAPRSERALARAEQLGSVNAAVVELGTTWPSLCKAFTRCGLGMPASNPKAVRQRAIAATGQRAGQPASDGPGLLQRADRSREPAQQEGQARRARLLQLRPPQAAVALWRQMADSPDRTPG